MPSTPSRSSLVCTTARNGRWKVMAAMWAELRPKVAGRSARGQRLGAVQQAAAGEREVVTRLDADVSPVQVGPGGRSGIVLRWVRPARTAARSVARRSRSTSPARARRPRARGRSRRRSRPGSIRPQKIGSSTTVGEGSSFPFGSAGAAYTTECGIAAQQLAADEQHQRSAEVGAGVGAQPQAAAGTGGSDRCRAPCRRGPRTGGRGCPAGRSGSAARGARGSSRGWRPPGRPRRSGGSSPAG